MADQIVRNRLSTNDTYERILLEAREEMDRSVRELLFSAVAGGLAISITFLLYASVTAATDGAPVVSAILYPLGFIYIIIGNYQLYTENTLPPVALIIDRIASLPALLRMYGIVLTGNVIGAGVGGLVLIYGGVFDPASAAAATDIAMTGVATDWWPLFFKGAFAGLIVAGVVWMDYSVRGAGARIALIYLAFLAIPVGGLFHVVVAATEVTFLVADGAIVLWAGIYGFALPVLLGNTAGGILLVTIVNYYQTCPGIHRFEGVLSYREWLSTMNTGAIPIDRLRANLQQSDIE